MIIEPPPKKAQRRYIAAGFNVSANGNSNKPVRAAAWVTRCHLCPTAEVNGTRVGNGVMEVSPVGTVLELVAVKSDSLCSTSEEKRKPAS